MFSSNATRRGPSVVGEGGTVISSFVSLLKLANKTNSNSSCALSNRYVELKSSNPRIEVAKAAAFISMDDSSSLANFFSPIRIERHSSKSRGASASPSDINRFFRSDQRTANLWLEFGFSLIEVSPESNNGMNGPLAN
jgi:hypothetical protein